MAVHPMVAKWLIDLVGWREAWIWLGISTWVLLLPPVLLFVVSKPEDVGLRPDGVSTPADIGKPQGATEEGDENDFTLSEALRTPTFYIVAAGLFTLSMLVTTLHFFQVSIFSDQGLDTEVATVAFAVSAVTMIAMMPTLGRMLDRFPTERMFAGGLLVLATTLVIAAQVSGITSAVLYALAFGVANAVSMTYYTFMWPRYFGRTHLGSIQGTGQMIGVVGASLGPLPLGFAKDYFGNYDAMLVGLAVIPLIGAIVAALFLRQPVKLKPL
jgi:MFS family permease